MKNLKNEKKTSISVFFLGKNQKWILKKRAIFCSFFLIIFLPIFVFILYYDLNDNLHNRMNNFHYCE